MIYVTQYNFFLSAMTVSTKNKFYEQLKIFLNSKDGRRHRNDIIWNKNMKVIKVV